MNRTKTKYLVNNFKYLIGFFLIIVFSIFIWLTLRFSNVDKNYVFFIEFKNVHGIYKGTPIRFRGVTIGSIKNLKFQLNSVLTLAEIYSSRICIPKNSIIETNQTGLLNETVVDIIPLEKVIDNESIVKSPLSELCYSYDIICDSMYLEGDRGLNYDDLIRSTTRISQRFDDPRFFNVFYVFLHNAIELSDNILELTMNISDIVGVLYFYMQRFL